MWQPSRQHDNHLEFSLLPAFYYGSGVLFFLHNNFLWSHARVAAGTECQLRQSQVEASFESYVLTILMYAVHSTCCALRKLHFLLLTQRVTNQIKIVFFEHFTFITFLAPPLLTRDCFWCEAREFPWFMSFLSSFRIVRQTSSVVDFFFVRLKTRSEASKFWRITLSSAIISKIVSRFPEEIAKINLLIYIAALSKEKEAYERSISKKINEGSESRQIYWRIEDAREFELIWISFDARCLEREIKFFLMGIFRLIFKSSHLLFQQISEL